MAQRGLGAAGWYFTTWQYTTVWRRLRRSTIALIWLDEDTEILSEIPSVTSTGFTTTISFSAVFSVLRLRPSVLESGPSVDVGHLSSVGMGRVESLFPVAESRQHRTGARPPELLVLGYKIGFDLLDWFLAGGLVSPVPVTLDSGTDQ